MPRHIHCALSLLFLLMLSACGDDSGMPDASSPQDAALTDTSPADGNVAEDGGLSDGDVATDAPMMDGAADGLLMDGGMDVFPAPWRAGPAFPHPIDHHTTAIIEGSEGPFLYVLGGMRVDERGQPLEVYDGIYRSPIAADGTLGPWEAQSPLPLPMAFHAIAQTDDALVLLGGLTLTDGSIEALGYVLAAAIEADGSLSGWRGEPYLMEPVTHGSAVVLGSRVYLAGGGAGLSRFNDTVLSFAIESSDEGPVVSAPRSETSLPTPRSHHASVLVGSDWYLLGGMTGAGTPSTDVLRAAIEGDHITGWEDAGHTRVPHVTGSAFAQDDIVWVLGGAHPSGFLATISRFQAMDGELNQLEETRTLPTARGHVHQTPIFNGRLYSIGGRLLTGGAQSSATDSYFGPISE